ncbi:hypothetical protein OG21DRAFT_1514684 [Imleria badia]|nr:hypothetical protein OG21DRAFT_1514684 [Imleria badia]
MILILEHSFKLLHEEEGVDQPLLSAVQKYQALGLHGRLEEALKEVFKQYGKASPDQKMDMVTNMILQNHLGLVN